MLTDDEREMLEKACKVVCPLCADNVPYSTDLKAKIWEHWEERRLRLSECRAKGIRKFIAALPSPPAESETK